MDPRVVPPVVAESSLQPRGRDRAATWSWATCLASQRSGRGTTSSTARSAPSDAAAAEAVAAALYEEALGVYRRWFDQTSPVWAYLTDTMATWHDATSSQAPGHIGDRRPGDDRVLSGNPRVSAGRSRSQPTRRASSRIGWRSSTELDRCLDHVLHALVLYDHILDWETDLKDGRWNAFIVRVTEQAWQARDRSRDRTRVLVGMMTTDAIRDEFAVIDRELTERRRHRRGARHPSSRRAGWCVSPRRNRQQATRIQAHYQALASQAAQLLLGSAPAPGL